MIEIEDKIARPLNLANSEVLRAVEEEEQMKCEPVKCERQSRSRQRIYQQTHTPVHQQQLEQIKTQYLSHQHDITIDRDTVLKINRLAERRNFHKREHSWPPTTTTRESSATTAKEISTHEQLNNVEKNGKILKQEQHIRSTSIDNALQFDETVCKRHGIDMIREIFNSPTRIIEPTAQEVRKKREQERRIQKQQQKQQQMLKQHQKKHNITEGGSGADNCDAAHGVTTNKPKQMINLVKHEELLRKNAVNKSATMMDTTSAQKAKEKRDLIENTSISEQQSTAMMSTEKENNKKSLDLMVKEDELFKTTTIPLKKGFSHPETKAADEDIGLVEPKRQYYEQLSSDQKWHSYENLNALSNVKTNVIPLPPQRNKRHAYSLERGREVRKHKQLPPQKPRTSSKLQRRCMKLATEIKISYDNDAQQNHNIQVKSLNQPTKPNSYLSSTNQQDDLEHLPLPATPGNSRQASLNVQQGAKHHCQLDYNATTKSFKEQQTYDDSCIFLRSVDLQDNTVAYIPAAITIVPSPTEEIMQNWMDSTRLKANITAVNDITEMKASTTKACTDFQNKSENLMSHIKQEPVKSKTIPEGIKHQLCEQKQQQENGKLNAETATYVTRLPSTPNGIQLVAHQPIVNSKRKPQMNNNNDNKENKNNSSNLVLAATNETSQHTRPPGAQQAKATSAECKKIAEECYSPQQPGVYYTDGEYVYGSFDQQNGTPLANATVRSLQAEQQEKHEELQKQTEIKKYIEAETNTQHKNEIANLTAKYENIQKSINEHLRQIDTYIGNTKAALKSTIATGDKPKSSTQKEQPQTQAHCNHSPYSLEDQLEQTQQENAKIETPLKEILRKITTIMQEVKPFYRNQNAIEEEICIPASPARPPQTVTCNDIQQDEEENMPIVDKVLMDLNMLTKHLSEFDKSSGEELKPIMEHFDLQFERRPTASTASHVLINEETVNKDILMERGKHHEKSEAVKNIVSLPPTPPPLPVPATTIAPAPASAMTLKKHMQEKRTQHDADKQLLATDKQIIAKTKSQQCASNEQQRQQLPHQQTIKGPTTVSVAVPKDNDTATADTNAGTTAAAAAASTAVTKYKNKNFVFDFITAQHEQEQLVEQIIDTLGKLENETKEKLVNTHVPEHDEQIKSNLNQQTPTSETTKFTNNMEEDVVIMQNCNISVSPNTSSEDTCNHDNNVSKLTQGNESQLKLHIKNFADKKSDKQFTKYDKHPSSTQNTNDVVNISKTDKSLFSQKQDDDKYVRPQCQFTGEDNKVITIKEEEGGGSNHSSGSELSNTNKSSYELPSPYITLRQISWEDVLSTATKQTTANLLQTQQISEKKQATPSSVLTNSVNIVKPKHGIEAAQICYKSPLMLDNSEPKALTLTPSGHVAMQSTNATKQRIQTTQQQELKQSNQYNQQHLDHSPEEGRKYPVSLIQPHLPTRSTSPFGLNAIEIPFKQRSSSVSPTRLHTQDATTSTMAARQEFMQAIRKYPSSLAKPHLPTRDTSQFGLNAIEEKNLKRSASISPKRTKSTQRTSPVMVDEISIRKYPAPLAEPHVPPRAVSPFGLNPVDVFRITRAATPLPANEVLSDNKQREEDHYADEHVDKLMSPIRKYPPLLIEPHVPKRAASPFGLNVVETTQKANHRMPSTICRPRSHHQYRHHDGHHEESEEKILNSSSSTTSDTCKKPIFYVPQVEGHNIGLLVRTSSPTPYCHTDATHASSTHSGKYITHYNVTATTNRYIADNKHCTANDIERDGEDDDRICEELQCIIAIDLTKQGATATNETIEHNLHQPQQQEQQKQQQQRHDETHLHNQEQYSGGSGQHMAIDTISLPTSIINRSFDNVSPRPYVSIEGYKRVAWPPASEERIVREFTPQPQTQYQPAPAYNQQYQPSATAAATASAVPSTQQQYRPPSYDNYQQPQYQQPSQQQQQQQYPPQPQYQTQAPQACQNSYQQAPQAGSYYQPPSQQSARPQQQAQQQYQQPPWVQQPQQQQQQYPPQQQPQYQNPLNNYHQAPHQQQQQYPLQENQFVPQTNQQQQFNSYSQPQQQQHTVSHDQVDQQQHLPPHLSQDQRGASPGIITLRKEAPVTQKPAPVYSSQPAAISFRESSVDSAGGSNMRGDLKWPPPEYKEAAVKENEERRKLALGPVCRPRKTNRDYTSFFAKNALSHHYPSYKVPPGTQHMIN